MVSKKCKIQKINFPPPNIEEFQELVEKFLVKQGWNVYNIKKKNDNSVDIIARKKDNLIDFIEVIYQLKRYKNSTPVKVNIIRELEHLVSHKHLTKGVIITTNTLSINAIKLIRFYRHKLAYKDSSELEYLVSQDEQQDDLPF